MAAKELSVIVTAVDQLTGPTRAMASSVIGIGDAAEKAGAKSESGFARAYKAIFSVHNAIAAVAAKLAGSEVREAIVGTAEEIEHIGAAGEALGLTVTQAAKLKYAADISHTAWESLAKEILTAQKNVAEFVDSGKGTAAEFLLPLRDELTDSEGKIRDVMELLPIFKERLEAIPDAAERVRRVGDIFGGKGAALNVLPFLSSDIKASFEEAKRLGVAFSEEQAKAAELVTLGVNHVRAAVLGLKASFVRELGPDIGRTLDSIASAIAAVPEVVSNVVHKVREIIDDGPLAQQATQELVNLANSVYSLVQTLAIGGVRVLWETLDVALGHMFDDLGPRIAAHFSLTVENAISEALGSKKKATWKDAAELFGIKDLKASLDEEMQKQTPGVFSDTWKEYIRSVITEGQSIAAATDQLLGFSDALAKTTIEGLRTTQTIQRLQGATAGESRQDFWGGVRQGIAQVSEEAENLHEQGTRAAVDIEHAFAGNLSTAIVDTVGRVKSLKDAFREFASSTLRHVADVVTQMLVLRAVAGIASAVTGGAGAGGGIGPSSVDYGGAGFDALPSFANAGGLATRRGVLRFAGGGWVPGGGPDRDSVPAMLTPGEFVLTRGATRRAGVGNLMALNRGGAVPAGGGGGGGGGHTFNVTTNVSFGGSAPSTPQDQARLAQMIEKHAKAGVEKAMQQDPAYRGRMRNYVRT